MQLDVGQHKELLQSTISFCKHEKSKTSRLYILVHMASGC